MSTTREDLHDFIDNNPVDGRKHYQDWELDADLYSYQHNRYASKDSKTKAAVSPRSDKESMRIIDKTFGPERSAKVSKLNKEVVERTIWRYESKYSEIETEIPRLIENLNELELLLEPFEEYGEEAISWLDLNEFWSKLYKGPSISSDVDKMPTIEDVKTAIEYTKRELEKCKRDLEKTKEDLDKLHHNQFPLDDVEGYSRLIEEIDQEISAKIKEAIDNMPLRNAESKNRNKFLDQHADEAGSKARKLEGRQGKHKGKHK